MNLNNISLLSKPISKEERKQMRKLRKKEKKQQKREEKAKKQIEKQSKTPLSLLKLNEESITLDNLSLLEINKALTSQKLPTLQ